MQELQGKYTSAVIYSGSIEDYALSQIQTLIDNPVFAGSRVRIMPDVHPGQIGPIGFTATVGSSIMPGIVGIDIGCGMTAARLKAGKPEFQRLDSVIRDAVPSGFQIRKAAHRFGSDFDYDRLLCAKHVNRDKAERSVGTLGGGNHFIELDMDKGGELWAVIHSGSRHLGKEVSEYYLNEGQKYWKSRNIKIPHELTPLEGELMEAYVHDTIIVQEFAALNREAILDELCRGMKWKILESRSCVHNYIDVSGTGISNNIPAAETKRTKLKKYGGLYRELSKEKAALEKKLASASGESIRKKLEINQKLRELE